MIVSFGNKDTEKVWRGEKIKKPSLSIQKTAYRKLRMLNNSKDLQDLQIPPSNRLEKLTGTKGFYSIRINNQWRIIFQWKSGLAYQVEIIDYH